MINERRTSEYNDNGQLLKQTAYNTSNVVTSILDYTNGYDTVGTVLKYTVQVTQGTAYTNTYNYNYLKYDTYKESVINATSTYWAPGNTTST